MLLKPMQGMVGSSQTTGVEVVNVHFFWWCNNPHFYLPLIALQYHEVKLKFTWGVTTVGIGYMPSIC